MTYLLCRRMEVPHLMSIRSMECWLATPFASSAIMSHALEPIKSATIGSSTKVLCQSSPLFACMVTLFFFNPTLTFFYFFLEATFSTRPKNVSFPYGILLGSRRSIMCVETSNLRDVSAQGLCSNKGELLSGTSWN